MKRAFTLVELVIVIAILGIVAAIVVPYFRGEVTVAKEAAAKEHLRSLRGAIELYATRHGGVAPGYAGSTPDATAFVEQIVAEGECLRKMPENPFNNLDTILMIGDTASLPTDGTGAYGWIYQPATRTICLDWPNADVEGVRYLDY